MCDRKIDRYQKDNYSHGMIRDQLYVSTIYINIYLTVFLTFFFYKESNGLLCYMTIMHIHFIGNLLSNHQHMKLMKHKQDLLYSGRYQDYDYNHRYP